MSIEQICWTNPHPEVDLLMRIRLLELQVTAVADAVRLIAEELDNGAIAKRVTDLFDEARIGHL